MTLKVGQIGVGYLGERHCAVLSQATETELVGVYDINPDKSEAVAKAYHTRSFDRLEELLRQVEAVVVAVPTRNHFQIVRQALSAGCHVFVEKPISSTVSEARSLVQLAEQRDLILQVGHIERFNPALRALDREKLAPMFIEAHRLALFDPRGTDVAVVLDLMIHDLDIILHLVQSPVKRIDASGVAVISPEIDIANARLQFENGCVANVTASRISQKKMRKMRLFQKDAYIAIDFLKRSSEVYRLVRESDGKAADGLPVVALAGPDGEKRQIVHQRLESAEGDPLRTELESFLHCVRCGEKPLVDGNVATRVLEVAIEITRIIEA